ncbi:histidine phosphatase family protein [Lentzea sp. NPDC059081]|uniref:histidine phosphatase family protein n=1 Tax=Lentzea sp. NPDC059081 TaxID=3346719 RepID=UPI003681BC98
MRAEVVLVRHARSTPPRPGGRNERLRSLTTEGLAQAEHLAAHLAELAPSLIVSSPYLRAVQTVEPLARKLGMPVRTSNELREWDSGIVPTPDSARHHAESWANPHAARPGAESLHQLTSRATAALTSLARGHQDELIVVGSHGTFISRALVGFGVDTVDHSFAKTMPTPTIYRLRFTGRGVEIIGPGL